LPDLIYFYKFPPPSHLTDVYASLDDGNNDDGYAEAGELIGTSSRPNGGRRPMQNGTSAGQQQQHLQRLQPSALESPSTALLSSSNKTSSSSSSSSSNSPILNGHKTKNGHPSKSN
jgi:hypothetical protein